MKLLNVLLEPPELMLKDFQRLMGLEFDRNSFPTGLVLDPLIGGKLSHQFPTDCHLVMVGDGLKRLCQDRSLRLLPCVRVPKQHIQGFRA